LNNKYLHPKRIEFLVTYLCNGYCKHCSAQKQTNSYPQHIDEKLASKIVEDTVREYEIESIMTFGGESLLFPEIVYSIHNSASKSGIPIRELITNGYWSNKVEEIRIIASNLAKNGVNVIHFFVDAFHQETIPIDTIRNTVESCIEAGIESLALNPCWLVSEDNDNKYNEKTRSLLEEFEDLSVKISSGNLVEPEGMALVYLRDYFSRRDLIPKGSCNDVPYSESLDDLSCISIEPDGMVAVCKDVYIGDASRTDIVQLVKNYQPFQRPELRAIIENGMEGLVELAKKRGIEPDPEGYYTICHLCTDLRKRMATMIQ
jgi:sulfatase maturation enzyme AslB (radical SAM superfamily)